MIDSSLLQDPALTTFAIAWLTLVAERALKVKDQYHPLTFFQLLFQRLGAKVNRPGSDPKQQLISGTLAFPVLILPMLTILWLLFTLAEFPRFFDALLLFTALRYEHQRRLAKKIGRTLIQGKKTLARDLLKTMVLRDTSSLSPMGISKAAIQGLLLRGCYQQIAVLFWFFVAGGLGAIAYRLAYDASQSWNIKLPVFRHFGAPMAALVSIASWLPMQLALVCGLLAGRMAKGVKALRRVPGKTSPNVRLLAGLGGALNVQLGGPTLYAGNKHRLQKVGGDMLPAGADVQQAAAFVDRQLTLLFGLSLIVTAVTMALLLRLG